MVLFNDISKFISYGLHGSVPPEHVVADGPGVLLRQERAQLHEVRDGIVH